MDASSAAKPSSFFSSCLWKRRFSSSMHCPSCRFAASALALSPITSAAMGTSMPSSSDRRAATGFKEYFILNSPFGRPRCEHRMSFAPWPSRYLMVGRDSTIRLSSVMLPSPSRGTLKSQRARTFLPFTSISSIDFLFSAIRSPLLSLFQGLLYPYFSFFSRETGPVYKKKPFGLKKT